jgi:hypothetical protein
MILAGTNCIALSLHEKIWQCANMMMASQAMGQHLASLLSAQDCRLGHDQQWCHAEILPQNA